MSDTIKFQTKTPELDLAKYIESFWSIENVSPAGKEVVVLPDGRVDIFFSYSDDEPFHITLMGLEVRPAKATFRPKTTLFAISLKLLAVEYLLGDSISDLLNTTKILPINFWGFSKEDLKDFDSFCNKATERIRTLLPKEIDKRKHDLFQLVYSTKGSYTVTEYSKAVFWSSRQINRYFTQTFGLPLKMYCGILRFRASFDHIKQGKLFPELNFADQAHFIKEVKKLSGVIPKELSKNENDRFIQLSALPKK